VPATASTPGSRSLPSLAWLAKGKIQAVAAFGNKRRRIAPGLIFYFAWGCFRDFDAAFPDQPSFTA
jgi:hypothetical protein